LSAPVIGLFRLVRVVFGFPAIGLIAVVAVFGFRATGDNQFLIEYLKSGFVLMKPLFI
jgi:hypothetical protein